MSQRDFEFLAVEDEHFDEEGLRSNATGKSFRSVQKEDAVVQTQAKPVKETSKEDYIPVNFITDEVYAMIAAWEASNSTVMASSDQTVFQMPLLSVAQSIVEPHRRQSEVSAPKRFYRVFWTSVSRRILASSREHNTIP